MKKIILFVIALTMLISCQTNDNDYSDETEVENTITPPTENETEYPNEDDNAEENKNSEEIDDSKIESSESEGTELDDETEVEETKNWCYLNEGENLTDLEYYLICDGEIDSLSSRNENKNSETKSYYLYWSLHNLTILVVTTEDGGFTVKYLNSAYIITVNNITRNEKIVYIYVDACLKSEI